MLTIGIENLINLHVYIFVVHCVVVRDGEKKNKKLFSCCNHGEKGKQKINAQNLNVYIQKSNKNIAHPILRLKV